MAPHTEEYLQDLFARYLVANRILSLCEPQPAFEDLTWEAEKLYPLFSEVRSNLDQLLEEPNHCGDISTTDVSTWEHILAAEAVNDHEHSASAEGVPEMMADAMRSLNQPLTKQMLCDWHYRLYATRICTFPIGDYRGTAEGPVYFQDAGFVATEADRVEDEMGRFITWFNVTSKQIDPLLRVAIAPLWFLTVHPYGNGNGRISRAIAEMALAQIDPRIQKSFSVAKQLMLEKDDYVKALGKGRGTSDITEHLAFFLGCLERAIRSKNAQPKS
jgi:Fic family protein